MESFVELMKRLVEIERDDTQRSAALVAEDRRLIEGLQIRIMASKPPQSVELDQENSGAT